METAYLVCAIVGGTLITCQFLLSLLGLGGDHGADGHDGGADAGHDGGADGDHGADGHDGGADGGHGASWFLGWLTFRTLSAAPAFFGLVGLAARRAEVDPEPAFVLALAAGVGAAALVGWLMRQFARLNLDGTVRIERSVGRPGVVYLSIPAGRAGAGKVHVSVHARTLEVKAVTDHDALPTGTPVVVVAVVGRDTVHVSRVHEPEGVSHV